MIDRTAALERMKARRRTAFTVPELVAEQTRALVSDFASLSAISRVWRRLWCQRRNIMAVTPLAIEKAILRFAKTSMQR